MIRCGGSTAQSATKILGASDRIRLGLIGGGARGTYFMCEASREQDVEWTSVCDAWDQRRRIRIQNAIKIL